MNYIDIDFWWNFSGSNRTVSRIASAVATPSSPKPHKVVGVRLELTCNQIKLSIAYQAKAISDSNDWPNPLASQKGAHGQP